MACSSPGPDWRRTIAGRLLRLPPAKGVGNSPMTAAVSPGFPFESLLLGEPFVASELVGVGHDREVVLLSGWGRGGNRVAISRKLTCRPVSFLRCGSHPVREASEASGVGNDRTFLGARRYCGNCSREVVTEAGEDEDALAPVWRADVAGVNACPEHGSFWRSIPVGSMAGLSRIPMCR